MLNLHSFNTNHLIYKAEWQRIFKQIGKTIFFPLKIILKFLQTHLESDRSGETGLIVQQRKMDPNFLTTTTW